MTQPTSDQTSHSQRSDRVFVRRVLVAVAIVAAVILLLLLVWQAIPVLLLVFAGILLAVFLDGIRNWLSQRTPLSRESALAVVGIVLLAVLGLGGWLAAPQITRQATRLGQSLTAAVRDLTERLSHYAWVQQLFAQLPTPGEVISGQYGILTGVTGVVSNTFNILIGVVILLFIGLYLAAKPDLYVDGIVKLVPIDRRERAREVLAALGHTLRWWLVGRFFNMGTVGVLSVIGLWLLGVPLAGMLGIVTALLAFVPIIGPTLSVIPPALIALTISPQRVVSVVLLYAGIQFVESYILTPLVQERAVSLPPVLTLTSQVLLGLLVGPLGVALAPPLAAITIVLTKMLYVEDALGDENVTIAHEGSDQ